MLENGEEGARTRDVDIPLCRMKAAAVGIAFSVVSAEACASPLIERSDFMCMIHRLLLAILPLRSITRLWLNSDDDFRR
jgi:hypothetical protein